MTWRSRCAHPSLTLLFNVCCSRFAHVFAHVCCSRFAHVLAQELNWFEAVLRWTEADRSGRAEAALTRITPHLRIPLLTVVRTEAI